MSDNIKLENDWRKEFANFNAELEEKILEANHDSSKVKWSKLLPELMDEEVFIAGQIPDEQPAENGSPNIALIMVQNNGHSFIPFFTSPERLSVLASPNNNQFDVVKIKVANFFMTVRGKSAIMNPMSTYSRVFTPFEMKILSAEYFESREPEKKQA